jgi:chorismate mutase
MKTINTLREEIDQVHGELHALLVKRRDLTMAVWKLKQAQGLPFFDSAREAQILKEFVARGSAQDPQMDKLAANVMQSILREYETYLRAQFPSED